MLKQRQRNEAGVVMYLVHATVGLPTSGVLCAWGRILKRAGMLLSTYWRMYNLDLSPMSLPNLSRMIVSLFFMESKGILST